MVENLKDLEKLLKLCRKQGVTEITLRGCAFKLGDLPVQTQGTTEEAQTTEEPSMEDLMFYSARGPSTSEVAQ